MGGKNVYNVWQVSNDCGNASGGNASSFSSRQLATGKVLQPHVRPPSEYITPRSTSPLFDLPCLSSLFVVPASHAQTNAYPALRQPQGAPNRSTARESLHLPLEPSYVTVGLGRVPNQCGRDMLLRPVVLMLYSFLILRSCADNYSVIKPEVHIFHFLRRISLEIPPPPGLGVNHPWVEVRHGWNIFGNVDSVCFFHLRYKTIQPIGIIKCNRV